MATKRFMGQTHSAKKQKGSMAMDPAKTWFYVGLDLFVKAAAALSVAVIGFVGWRLQKSNSEQAERRRDQEQAETARRLDEQRYLPMFDSLAALELTLDEALRTDRPTPTQLRDLADVLGWRNISLFVPPEAATQIKIPSFQASAYAHSSSMVPDEVKALRPEHFQCIEVRDAISVAASVLRVAAVVQENVEFAGGVEGTSWVLQGEHLFVTGDGPALSDEEQSQRHLQETGTRLPVRPTRTIPIEPEVRGIWSDWLKNDDSPHLFLDYGASRGVVRELLVALRYEVARILREALLAHPSLGEKYLAIRTNILTNKTLRMPPPRSDRHTSSMQAEGHAATLQ